MVGVLGLLLGAGIPKLKHLPQALAATLQYRGVRLLVWTAASGLCLVALAAAIQSSEVSWPALKGALVAKSLSVHVENFYLPTLLLYVVLGLTLMFVALFAVRALVLKRHLSRVIRAAVLAQTGSDSGAPERVGSSFTWPVLTRPWQNYCATLVATTEPPESVRVWRAAIPSIFFFSRDALIDGFLLDSFGRHLPGILTGLGIVGTFSGMLEALNQFDPSTAESAAVGLKGLLSGVSHAFVASMGAISCAVFVTAFSRTVIAHLQKRVETLTHELDRLYPAGAGECQLSGLHSTMNGRGVANQLDAEVAQQSIQQLVELLSQNQIQARLLAEEAENRRQFFEERLLSTMENALLSMSTSSNSPSTPALRTVRQNLGAGLEPDASAKANARALVAIISPQKADFGEQTEYTTGPDNNSEIPELSGMKALEDVELQAGFEQRIVFSINRKLDQGFARIERKIVDASRPVPDADAFELR